MSLRAGTAVGCQRGLSVKRQSPAIFSYSTWGRRRPRSADRGSRPSLLDRLPACPPAYQSCGLTSSITTQTLLGQAVTSVIAPSRAWRSRPALLPNLHRWLMLDEGIGFSFPRFPLRPSGTSRTSPCSASSSAAAGWVERGPVVGEEAVLGAGVDHDFGVRMVILRSSPNFFASAASGSCRSRRTGE